MNKRYLNMTMKELLTLKARKTKEIHKLLRSGLSKDKAQAVRLEEHIVLINAEIASRVQEIGLWD